MTPGCCTWLPSSPLPPFLVSLNGPAQSACVLSEFSQMSLSGPTLSLWSIINFLLRHTKEQSCPFFSFLFIYFSFIGKHIFCSLMHIHSSNTTAKYIKERIVQSLESLGHAWHVPRSSAWENLNCVQKPRAQPCSKILAISESQKGDSPFQNIPRTEEHTAATWPRHTKFSLVDCFLILKSPQSSPRCWYVPCIAKVPCSGVWPRHLTTVILIF